MGVQLFSLLVKHHPFIWLWMAIGIELTSFRGIMENQISVPFVL
jgi:hypothetical protein